MDPDWAEFSAMVRPAAQVVRDLAPGVRRVLGGMSPIDPEFLRKLQGHGVLEDVDTVAVHGFPLDWNLWKLDDWPKQLDLIRAVTDKPLWVTEVGASTFGADEVQTFALRRTAELLRGQTERVFWYSLLDLPPTWEATTRHKEAEGSSYYRHFYLGLLRADGTPKPSAAVFPEVAPEFGICQWFHFDDHRLEFAADWLRRLGVTKLRTGISWADWHRPNALEWFDRQMDALSDFDVTVTLCFTPPSRGRREHHTSPPQIPEEFSWFTAQVIRRYVLCEGWTPSRRAVLLDAKLDAAAREDEEMSVAGTAAVR